jgi:hypothetical protein
MIENNHSLARAISVFMATVLFGFAWLTSETALHKLQGAAYDFSLLNRSLPPRLYKQDLSLFGNYPNSYDVTVTITGEKYPCVGGTYKYSFEEAEPLGKGYSHVGYKWVVQGGVVVGSDTGYNVDVKWNNISGGVIYLTFTYYYIYGQNKNALNHLAVLPRFVVNNSSPVLANAPASNPNYIPVGTNSVLFTTEPIKNADSYLWTIPSCFVAASTITSEPQISVQATGTCSGNVCVQGRNNGCAFNSNTTCLPVTRVPNISPIEGPGSFCKTNLTTMYSTSMIPGITEYTWNVPNGWIINGISALGPMTLLAANNGHKITLAAPTGMVGDISGNVSVYGTISSVGSSNTQAKTVVINYQAPTVPPFVSPSIKITNTVTNAKKKITVTLPNLNLPYSWECRVTGIGVSSTYTGQNGNSLSFIMTNNNDLVIQLFRSNSCGKLNGSQYSYRLVNGALKLKVLQ